MKNKIKKKDNLDNNENNKARNKIKLQSDKIKDRENKIKIMKIGMLIITLFLIIIYFILRVVYETGNFTVSLDPNFATKQGLIMYEKKAEKEDRRVLKAEKLEFMDNISVKWLPDNIDDVGEGSHNGDNYLAYTFYLENKVKYLKKVIFRDELKKLIYKKREIRGRRISDKIKTKRDFLFRTNCKNL